MLFATVYARRQSRSTASRGPGSQSGLAKASLGVALVALIAFGLFLTSSCDEAPRDEAPRAVWREPVAVTLEEVGEILKTNLVRDMYAVSPPNLLWRAERTVGDTADVTLTAFNMKTQQPIATYTEQHPLASDLRGSLYYSRVYALDGGDRFLLCTEGAVAIPSVVQTQGSTEVVTVATLITLKDGSIEGVPAGTYPYRTEPIAQCGEVIALRGSSLTFLKVPPGGPPEVIGTADYDTAMRFIGFVVHEGAVRAAYRTGRTISVRRLDDHVTVASIDLAKALPETARPDIRAAVLEMGDSCFLVRYDRDDSKDRHDTSKLAQVGLDGKVHWLRDTGLQLPYILVSPDDKWIALTTYVTVPAATGKGEEYEWSVRILDSDGETRYGEDGRCPRYNIGYHGWMRPDCYFYARFNESGSYDLDIVDVNSNGNAGRQEFQSASTTLPLYVGYIYSSPDGEMIFGRTHRGMRVYRLKWSP